MSRPQALSRFLTGKKRHKYNAQKTDVGCITFDSKAEAKHYCELLIREKAGEITDLELQPSFLLTVKDFYTGEYVTIAKCKLDFMYWDVQQSKSIVVDVKGVDTPISKLKRKHVEAQYGFTVELIKGS